MYRCVFGKVGHYKDALKKFACYEKKKGKSVLDRETTQVYNYSICFFFLLFAQNVYPIQRYAPLSPHCSISPSSFSPLCSSTSLFTFCSLLLLNCFFYAGGTSLRFCIINKPVLIALPFYLQYKFSYIIFITVQCFVVFRLSHIYI